jgi:hypothetical protein
VKSRSKNWKPIYIPDAFVEKKGVCLKKRKKKLTFVMVHSGVYHIPGSQTSREETWTTDLKKWYSRHFQVLSENLGNKKEACQDRNKNCIA